ncbi:MAG TPA: hypothetical protein VD978_31160 [Azospirillum sp.]|nr:hypothetical protein [Azospirillum sp.]
MSAKLIGRANILIFAFITVLSVLSAPAEARIVIESKAGPGAVNVAPRSGQWVPNTLFRGSLLPLPLMAAPMLCGAYGAYFNPALRARTERLFQQQQLAHTLGRAHFWRSQR